MQSVGPLRLKGLHVNRFLSSFFFSNIGPVCSFCNVKLQLVCLPHRRGAVRQTDRQTAAASVTVLAEEQGERVAGSNTANCRPVSKYTNALSFTKTTRLMLFRGVNTICYETDRETHTHTHTYICIYIYIYICVCITPLNSINLPLCNTAP